MMTTLGFGSSWADFILDAVQKLMDFAKEKAQELLGFDLAMFNIYPVLETFQDSYAFVDQAIPLKQCMTILLAAFVTKAGIRLARHVVGWMPGIDG